MRADAPDIVQHIRDLAGRIARGGPIPEDHDLPDPLAGLMRAMRRILGPNSQEAFRAGRVRMEVLERLAPARDISSAEAVRMDPRLGEVASIGGHERYSGFQISAWKAVQEAMDRVMSGHPSGVTIVAPAGGGKTEAFLLPVIHRIARHLSGDGTGIPRFAMIYPRRALVQDQIRRVLRYVRNAERLFVSGKKMITVGLQFGGIWSSLQNTLRDADIFEDRKWFRLVEECPWCGWSGGPGRALVHVRVPSGRGRSRHSELACEHCMESVRVSLSKEGHADQMPHLIMTTIESLDRMLMDPDFGDYLSAMHGVILDEVHLYHGVYGAHVAHLLHRLRERVRERTGRELVMIAASATIPDPEEFSGGLMFLGNPPPGAIRIVDASGGRMELSGLEIICFLQLGDRLTASATARIASEIAAGMLGDGGRMLVFTDSLDVARRISIHLSRMMDGEGEDRRRLSVQRITGKTRGSRALTRDIIVGTSALEVGIDDPSIRITVHHRMPPTAFEFSQRRGRAGRVPGSVSAAVVVLGQDPEDQFHLLGHRMIHGEYRLPVHPENPTVTEMHRLLETARRRIEELMNETGSNRSQAIMMWTLETLMSCPHLRRHLMMLRWIRKKGQKHGWSALREWIDREMMRLEEAAGRLRKLDELRNSVSTPEIREPLDGFLEAVEQWLHGSADDGSILRALDEFLLRTAPVRYRLSSMTPWEYRVVHGDLRRVDSIARDIREWVRQGTRGSAGHFRIWHDFFDEMSGLFRNHTARNIPAEAVRIVSRAMFMLHESLGHHGCPSDVAVHIPDAFFEDVRPVRVEVIRRDGSVETHADPVFHLADSFIPFRPIGRYGDHLCFLDGRATQISSERDAGEPERDTRYVIFRANVHGREVADPENPSSGAVMVRHLVVREVISGPDDEVGVCTRCLRIHDFSPRDRRCTACGAEGSVLPGSLRVEEAHVDHGILESGHPHPVGAGFELLPRIRVWTCVRGCRVSFRNMAFDVALRVPFYFEIHTSGIRWCVPDVLPPEPRPAVLHSAAHLLLRAVASVTGIRENQLGYIVDDRSGTVTVCELFDGGAGISKVFTDLVRNDPLRICRAMASIVSCPVYLADLRGQEWSDGRSLAVRLSRLFGLSPDDPVIRRAVEEALLEASAENRRPTCSVADRCPACVEISRHRSGIRSSAAPSPSRSIAERLAVSLIRQITGPADEDMRYS